MRPTLQAHKLMMEIGVGVCRAVRCNQELCALKVGRMDGCQLDLHRPVAQAGNWLHRDSSCAFCGLRLFPVSYTHLEDSFFAIIAYGSKTIICRKAKNDGSRAKSSKAPTLENATICQGPVSYTHLDVYKRQDYDRMLRVIASMEERGLDGEQAQIEAFYAVQKKK